ncbi:fructose-bisphosphate aldolase class I [Sphingomonas jinjuensis]|uniref:fructose-bisphosphate aldolase n=2 Tax=Sphingomonas jinjuensis TaxID=535907 RepID=A0A840FC74_9SPHN|nr:fructose bisphosphate aldolase [Sphingomonas jinjuensis]MBB4155239.1 fructose-bisphosphate aldolase class I [Sphingomonas jinjuensis]
MVSQHDVMMAQMVSGAGFIAALDQSGGSTPGALKAYGVAEGSWSSDAEMYELIHKMRVRIITAPSFNGAKVLAAILFEKTMDGQADGVPVPTALWNRGVVPFLKMDKGLEDEADGVQMMKPMPGLDELLARAKGLGVFGTKMRSVVKGVSQGGIARIVEQQFQIGEQIIGHGLMPILEPEVSLKMEGRAEAETILHDEILKHLDAMTGDRRVMLKLTIPAEADRYADLIGHHRVARVVALSGGYSRPDACAALAKNHGMIASFSRALLEDLRDGQSDEEFDRTLGAAIDEIYTASTVKN